MNSVPTNLKSDENGAGTDGEGDHSHKGTHDEVWMKNLALQRPKSKFDFQKLKTCWNNGINTKKLSFLFYHRVTQFLRERVLDLHRGLFRCSVLQLWEYFRPDQWPDVKGAQNNLMVYCKKLIWNISLHRLCWGKSKSAQVHVLQHSFLRMKVTCTYLAHSYGNKLDFEVITQAYSKICMQTIR